MASLRAEAVPWSSSSQRAISKSNLAWSQKTSRSCSAGQRVGISLVNNPAAPEIEGTVRLVTQRVNSADRLVDVFVSVPQGTILLLAAYVRGEIIVASRETLVVPRDAVLPDDGSYTLYVVQDHRAMKRKVQVGLQTDALVEVIDPELREGDQVVTVGNRELADEMQVKVLR